MCLSWSVTAFIILFEADYYYSSLATLNTIFMKIYVIFNQTILEVHPVKVYLTNCQIMGFEIFIQRNLFVLVLLKN